MAEEINEEHICCRCGKNMIEPVTGKSLVGFVVNLTTDLSHDYLPPSFIQKQMGVFKPNKKYELCFECSWLAAGFVER